MHPAQFPVNVEQTLNNLPSRRVQGPHGCLRGQQRVAASRQLLHAALNLRQLHMQASS